MQASSDKVPEKRSAHHPVLAVELNFDAERQALLKVFDEVRRKGSIWMWTCSRKAPPGTSQATFTARTDGKTNGKPLFKLPH
jgi:hypothetical protein